MTTTFAQYKSLVSEIAGASGPNYTTRLGNSINIAQDMLELVNWGFLNKSRTLRTFTGATVNFSLQDPNASYYDFGELSKDLTINDGTTTVNLVESTAEDIDNNALTNGQPACFNVSGIVNDVPVIKIGYPSPDTNGVDYYTIIMPYFKKLKNLSADGDISDFSRVYDSDLPMVYLAVSILYEMLENETKSQYYFGKGVQQVTLMESVVPFSGKPFAEIMRVKQWQQDTPA